MLRGLMSGRPHSPDHEIKLNEVAHVLLELPSADSLQEPRKRRLVRALSSRHRGIIIQYLVLVHRRGHDDPLAGVAAAWQLIQFQTKQNNGGPDIPKGYLTRRAESRT
ncbi:MAG TPA: hypothetical protein VJ828_13460 [Lacipirellulaceae bacterium]|nr:hypothetical protein [Lacipirellulaceae bacterium]